MSASLTIRNTKQSDFEGILELAGRVKPDSPWNQKLLEAHLAVFPEGQFVAVDQRQAVVGMTANLIILWGDYRFEGNWAEHTGAGLFTCHDAERGRTLYCAELLAAPEQIAAGIVAKLCDVRRRLARRRKLLRIRTAVPLCGYAARKDELSAAAFVESVLRGNIDHAILSLQLRRGLEVVAVLPQYFPVDSSSLGYAALLEWRNPAWSPDDVGLERAAKGADYTFRTNIHHIRRSEPE